MRWDRLFDDLEAEWEASHRDQSRAEVADRTRRERASVTLVARLAAQAVPVDVVTLGRRRIRGEVVDVGQDFVVLAEDGGRWVIPLAAVVEVGGLTRVVAGPADTAAVRRFGLGSALRAVARDRAGVRVVDLTGRTVTGTIDAVGADFLELVEHPLDVPRRETRARDLRVVPLWAVVAVGSA